METPPKTPVTDVSAWIKDLDGQLFSEGASFAERAFGVGCSLTFTPMAIILLLAFILGARGWVAFGVLVVIEVLLATIIATFLANRSRQGAMRRVYIETIWPQISDYLAESQRSLDDFKRQVLDILPADAPLSVQITRHSPASAPSPEEPDR